MIYCKKNSNTFSYWSHALYFIQNKIKLSCQNGKKSFSKLFMCNFGQLSYIFFCCTYWFIFIAKKFEFCFIDGNRKSFIIFFDKFDFYTFLINRSEIELEFMNWEVSFFGWNVLNYFFHKLGCEHLKKVSYIHPTWKNYANRVLFHSI